MKKEIITIEESCALEAYAISHSKLIISSLELINGVLDVEIKFEGVSYLECRRLLKNITIYRSETAEVDALIQRHPSLSNLEGEFWTINTEVDHFIICSFSMEIKRKGTRVFRSFYT